MKKDGKPKKRQKSSKPKRAPTLANAALATVRAAFADYSRILFVHYACDSFDSAKLAPPPIAVIVVKDGNHGLVHTFGLPQNERDELGRFAEFVTSHQDRLWVNWNVRDGQYGFEAIWRRLMCLGENVHWLLLPPESLLDLGNLVDRIYGSNYCSHPRLPKLVELNEIPNGGALDAQGALCAFERGEWETLRRSTARKVEQIEAIFRRVAQGTLAVEQVASGKWGPFTKRRMEFGCPRRRQVPRMSWPKILDAYLQEYEDDLDVTWSDLRLAHNRYCPKCSRQKSDR